MTTFSKRVKKNPDWFEAGIIELEPAITAKRTALLDYKRKPSEKALAALRKARNDAQRIARKCANDYWLNLCQSIQLSADCGNIRAMYEGMKKAFGPSTIKITPLKSATGDIITDHSKQHGETGRALPAAILEGERCHCHCNGEHHPLARDERT